MDSIGIKNIGISPVYRDSTTQPQSGAAETGPSVSVSDSFTASAAGEKTSASPAAVKNPSFTVSEKTSEKSTYPSITVGNISRSNTPEENEQLLSIKDAHRQWQTVTFTYDASQGPDIKNLQVVGSFNKDTGEYDHEWNKGKGIPMFDDGKTLGDKQAGDGVYTAQVKLKTDHQGEFQWGVKGDVYDSKGNLRHENHWLIMTEHPPVFSINSKLEEQTESYSPVTLHKLGVHKQGEDGVSFGTWSPSIGKGDMAGLKMHVDIYDEKTGRMLESIPMNKDEKTGNWFAEREKGWSSMEGKAYEYSIRDSEGNYAKNAKNEKVTYADPYARYLQGHQKGIERINVDPILGIETGWYNDSGSGGPNYQLNPLWGRFTVNGNEDADRVLLVLKDENGNQLNRQQLLDRLGAPELTPYDKASEGQRRNADILKSWQLDVSGKVTNYDWLSGTSEDGGISMHKVGGGNVSKGWVANMNNFPKLEGLQYEFQVYKDGKMVGDLNGDGVLQAGERVKTAFNDAYSNVIQSRPGAERMSLIKESGFTFRHSDVPRKETDFRKFTIYEAHVGSFRAPEDGGIFSNFGDMSNYLDYIEDLGYNTVEIMPFNEFGGKRDWGYTPDYYFAGTEAYGFEMNRSEAVERGIIRSDQAQDQETVWVNGTDAVKVFVDEAHKRGLNVICDVVYNHTSGKADGDNPQWNIGGDKNDFFKWPAGNHSNTPWGTKPNYAEQGVKNFFADNAVQQVQEFGVDGIRFDFTQVLHNTGDNFEKQHGMDTLRQINRTLAFFSPDGKPYTVAEDFTENWLVAADLDQAQWEGEGQWAMEKKGMGFDGVWSGPIHHKLLGAIDGKNTVDDAMNALVHHPGVNAPEKAVVFSHSHDEVGNSGTWAFRAGAKSRDDGKVMENYPRAVSRAAAAIIHTSAGVPMIFQGEEFVANNDFKHGATSTWVADYGWLDFRVTPDRLEHFKAIEHMGGNEKQQAISSLSETEKELYTKYTAMGSEEKGQAELSSLRAGHAQLYKELNALRASSDAFKADTPLQRLYTHNDNKVMAYERSDGKDRFVVVTNLADKEYNNYKLDMPGGSWKEVFNSNARQFGGTGSGNGGGHYDFDSGMVLPAGSTVVYKLT